MSAEESNIGVRGHLAKFAIGDWVKIDHDPVHCRVTAFLVRDRGHQYEVSWMNNGEPRTAWVEPYRLTPAMDEA